MPDTEAKITESNEKTLSENIDLFADDRESNNEQGHSPEKEHSPNKNRC